MGSELNEEYGFRYRRNCFVYRALLRLTAPFTRIRKQVLFTDFNGKHYSDNPRAISEKLHQLYPDFRIVWMFKKGVSTGNVPEYAEIVRKGTPAYFRALTRSCCFVTNEKVGRDLWKRKGQVFIQTWHGDRGIKKILYDHLGVDERKPWVMDEFLTDLFVVGSDYAEKRIQSAFRYHGETMKSGCPRNDCLIHPKNGDDIREKIGVKPGQKMLLYAPTLRKGQKVVQAKVDLDETLQHLNARGGEWVCLVRAHPKSLGVSVSGTGKMIDVSGYPDMADLLMITDCLITDYSSCAGDFILRRKPVILAQFDRDQYEVEGRSFYVDLRETGFLTAKNQEELNRILDSMTDSDFAENCEKVLRYFGTRETGHAAEDVCRWIDSQYQKDKGR